ncbi:MAG: hypothetical protein RLZZ543_411 [Bacteroidota bacterium]
METLQQRLFRFSPTGLFYALWLSSFFLPNLHPLLSPDTGNQVGEATMQGIDIAARTWEIYRYVFFFLGSWLATNLVFSHPVFQPHSLYYSFNSTVSKAGIVQVISGIFVPSLLPLAGLFAAVHIGIFISGKLPRKSVHTLSAPLAAAWTLIFWLQLIWWLPVPLTPVLHFFIWTIGFSGILTLIEQKFTLDTEKLMYWAFIFSFSVLAPFIVTELHYFILLRAGVHVAPALLSALYLALLLGIELLSRKKQWFKTTRPLLFKRIWLLIAIGLGIQQFYVPYGTAPKELFELANRATPLMEMHYFQVLPLLSKASSHFVSDYGFGIVYELLYGYQGLDFLVFDVIENILWIVIAYQLLHAITRKTLLSFYFVALFPFADAALSPYYILALIPLLVLISEWKHSRARNAWYFGISVVLLMPWRADLSFALVFCLAALLLISLLLKKITWKFLLPTVACALLFGIVLLGICIMKEIDWMNSLRLTIDYLSSSQSYGLTYMGDETSIAFRWEHLLLPLLVIACMLMALREFFQKDQSVKHLIPWLIVLFLGVFYLVNLPRGIVRHGFAEGYDNFLVSFAFFLVPLTIALQLPFKDAGKWMTFLGLLFVVMLFLRFPQRTPENTLLLGGLQHPVSQENIPHTLSPRLKINTAEIPADVFELVHFLRSELKAGETFIDFGNTPMLYFYAEKPVPAFFYQSPQNIHSESLQKDWLARISNYKAPILLFRHSPKNWWDETDGLPNEMRHSWMVEYFYQHYTPWQKRNGYELWKMKTLNDTVSIPTAFEERFWEHYQLKKQPAFWRPESQQVSSGIIQHSQTNEHAAYVELPNTLRKAAALMEVHIASTARLGKEAHVYFMQDSSDVGGLDFQVLASKDCPYVIRPSMHFSWWMRSINGMRIELCDSLDLKRCIFARPKE